MNEPITVSALAQSVWHDFRHARRVLVLYEVAFKFVEAWLLVPAIAMVLALVLSRAGHIAVSNQDILAFLLTPSGLLYAALFSTVAVALLLFEQAGIMVLVALFGAADRPSFKQAARAAFRKSLGIIQLGATTAGLLALALAPFVLLGVLTYLIFLSQHDIYFYLKERPPTFWVAAGIGVVLLLAAAAVVMFFYVRWAFALPILLFENQYSRAVLRASRERVRGAGWRVGLILLGWLLGVLLVGLALEAAFRLIAGAVIANAGGLSVVSVLLLLLAQGMLLASLSFVLVVGLGLVTRRLYLLRSEQLGMLRPDGWDTAPSMDTPASPWNWRLAWLSLPLFLLAPLALWVTLSRYLADSSLVRVTAHRGHAGAAPENTLSAMRKAIESGADYAEMDVQLTADDKVVLLHDRDLKRVAGVSRRLDELTYDEVRKLDVGSWFDPAFAGERVPTLADVIELCRGKIRLNIELKFFGADLRLAQVVAELLREQNFESHCLVTSLSYEGLRELKRHNSQVRTGLTVAHALGDISRVDVDALSVRAEFLGLGLLRSAHRRGMEVHVWTVNDASQMTRQMMRGVDNIITSDPDLAIQVRNEWESLTRTERLVLASRLLLGLDP
jgi:glycerophosphoryl diester phosphodiesterase